MHISSGLHLLSTCHSNWPAGSKASSTYGQKVLGVKSAKVDNYFSLRRHSATWKLSPDTPQVFLNDSNMFFLEWTEICQ